jgi:hypothetical protein
MPSTSKDVSFEFADRQPLSLRVMTPTELRIAIKATQTERCLGRVCLVSCVSCACWLCVRVCARVDICVCVCVCVCVCLCVCVNLVVHCSRRICDACLLFFPSLIIAGLRMPRLCSVFRRRSKTV